MSRAPKVLLWLLRQYTQATCARAYKHTHMYVHTNMHAHMHMCIIYTTLPK